MAQLITADDLIKASLKGQLEKYWQNHRQKYNSDPEVHRHPETVQGFLTKEKLHEMLIKPDENQLLIATGLTIIYDHNVAFFSDDGGFAINHSSHPFTRIGLPNVHNEYGEGKRYTSVDDIIKTHFDGKNFINSIEELVQYLNDVNVHKEDVYW